MERNDLRMNFRPNFGGQTVLVTGGANGIGAALVDFFLSAGADVAIFDRDEVRLKKRWGNGSDHIFAMGVDVAHSESVADAVEQATAWRGRLDVVVNNAGITRDSVVWKLTDQAWNDVISVHLTGTFNMTRAAIPSMRAAGFGRIINVTSFTGLHGNVGQANYAAAKAGIIGFTKSVAKEVARFGVTVNAVSPNAETAMVAAIPAEKRAEFLAQIPMGRFAQPEEMAAAVGFLASAEAAYITGVVLPVDGGMSM
jgi:3-oxoacyl-[acyl-carrier protein] reductase